MYPNSDATLSNTSAAEVASLDDAALDNAALDNAAIDNAVFEIAVTLPANLHARPAGKLAQAAARFASSIRIGYGNKAVNPTGVLSVMSLGATVGTVVTLHAEGPDAEEAVQTLARILYEAE